MDYDAFVNLMRLMRHRSERTQLQAKASPDSGHDNDAAAKPQDGAEGKASDETEDASSLAPESKAESKQNDEDMEGDKDAK